MDRFLTWGWRSILPAVTIVVPVILLCGCSSMRLHLNQEQVAALRMMSTSVVYVEPRQPLYAYAPGLVDEPGVPGDSSIGYGIAFGVFAFLAAETVHHRQLQQYSAFMQSMAPYKDVLGHLPISAQLLTTARAAFHDVPWYQDVDWKVVPASNDSFFYHDTAQLSGAQVVIFISPVAMIRNDAEVVRVDYRINVYVKNPDNKFDLQRFDSQIIGNQEKIYPGNQVPSNQLEDAFNDVSLDQRLKDIFSDNGALFRQTMTPVLAALRSRLTFYFTDTPTSDTSARQTGG